MSKNSFKLVKETKKRDMEGNVFSLIGGRPFILQFGGLVY
jgi:hypothetical protein